MPEFPRHTKYFFHDRSGDIVDPRVTRVSHTLLGMGHTASILPSKDSCVHIHEESEEFYLLLHGELDLYIAGVSITLQPGELLMVLPQVPHAVVGGRGRTEHFGFRAPFLNDKQIVSDIPDQTPTSNQRERTWKADWGCRIPLTTREHQNCWLIGWGDAKYQSKHLIFAYLNFPTSAEANAGIGSRLRMHYHQQSWEYYTVLKGRKVLQIENELISLDAGEIVEVPPLVRHNVHRREAPYEGFTIRVPIADAGDKVEDQL